MPPASPKPARILFITNTRIGDAVLSMGVLDHLIETHPGARITVACGPLPAPLFAAAPVEAVLSMEKLPYRRQWLRLWGHAATRYWDLVVDLRGSLISWLVPARRRIVYSQPLPDTHRVVELGALIGRADAPPAPRLWARESHLEAAEALVPEGRPVLAVGPTANWTGKQWPIDRFIEAVDQLTAPGGLMPRARVAVLAAPDEREAAQPLLDSLPEERRIDLIGKGDLAVIGACLSRCALYIGNDSGLMHMAAAAKLPVVGLFGPSREERYAPWGEHCAVVRGASYDDIMAIRRREGRNAPGLMDSVSVAAVTEAAERVMLAAASKGERQE